MLIDCQSCPVRGQRCGECMVTAVLAPPSADLPLDRGEQAAVQAFLDAGMVTGRHASTLRARPEPWGAFRAVG
jgi:hypothetical protein